MKTSPRAFVSLVLIVLTALSACVITPSAGPYARYRGGYGNAVAWHANTSPLAPQRTAQTSLAFQLAMKGQIEQARAAVAHGEGTEDDVRRGQKIYHDKQMLGGFFVGTILGMAALHQASGGGGEEHKCQRCFGNGCIEVAGDPSIIPCPDCGGKGFTRD